MTDREPVEARNMFHTVVALSTVEPYGAARWRFAS